MKGFPWRVFTAALFLVVFYSLPAYSQDEADGDTAGEKVIEVMGTSPFIQGPPPDDMAEPAVRAREDYRDRQGSIADIVESVPGVSVIEYGGEEGPWYISVRGSDPETVPVYLDGVLISDPLGNPYDLTLVPVPLVDEVIVYPTTAPHRYPVSGSGPVLDIRTMPAHSEQGGKGTYSRDTIGTSEASFYTAGPAGGGAALVGTSHQWGNGRFDYTDMRGTYSDDDDDEDATRSNNSFEDHDFMAKWDRKFQRVRIYTGGYYRHSTRELPGKGHVQAEKAHSSSKLALVYTGVRSPGVITPDLDVEARAHFQTEKRYFSDPDGELGPVRDDSYQRYRFGIDLYLDYYGIPGNNLSFYLGIYDDEYEPDSQSDPLAGDVSASRSSVYFAMTDELSLLNDRIVIKPRVRYLYESNEYEGPTITGQAMGGDEGTSYSAISPDMSMRFLVLESLWITANVGQYQRNPGFLEEYGDWLTLAGNPELTPETTTRAELGVSYDPGRLGAFDVFQADVRFYGNRYYNRVAWLDAGAGMMAADNIGESSSVGVSTSLQVNFGDIVDATLAYNYQRTEVVSDIDAIDGNQLPGMAENTVYLGITAYQTYGKIFYETYYQDVRYQDRENLLREGPRFVHNLGLTYWAGEFGLGAKAINLGDDRSREVPGYPLPGARYMIFVEVNG